MPPYSNERGGVVCCAAIDLFATASLTRGQNNHDLADTSAPDQRLAHAALEQCGLTGIQLSITADFPVGAGLGGSSAAGVAALGALAAWQNKAPSPAELAEESRKLEVERLGIAGGRQDHYAAAFGGVLGLWFDSNQRARHLASAAVARELGERCIVAYTGQSRISSRTISAVLDAYRGHDRRVVACLDRLRDLALSMISALESRDLDALGPLVREHWIHQRSLHPGIPTPLIDQVIELAHAAGATGGKALGASGGGCVLIIAPPERVAVVRSAIAPLVELLPIEITEQGFHVIPRPSPDPDSDP